MMTMPPATVPSFLHARFDHDVPQAISHRHSYDIWLKRDYTLAARHDRLAQSIVFLSEELAWSIREP